MLAKKSTSDTNRLAHFLRRTYYKVLASISEVTLTNDTTGFGLYDSSVINSLKIINDPYPYLRGLICELGYSTKLIEFRQPQRKKGFSKNNIYTLYDIAMLGVVNHSVVPIRMAALFGFGMGLFFFISALVVFIVKIFFWDDISLGVAPLWIVILFMFGLVLFFIGIIGEYIASIHLYVRRRPIVVERERVNF